jgi:hypothetical protein
MNIRLHRPHPLLRDARAEGWAIHRNRNRKTSVAAT